MRVRVLSKTSNGAERAKVDGRNFVESFGTTRRSFEAQNFVINEIARLLWHSHANGAKTTSSCFDVV